MVVPMADHMHVGHTGKYMLGGFYGDKYPKKIVTTVAIYIATAMAIIFTALLLFLHPSKGSRLECLISGGVAIFFGLSFFLYYVVEIWQTRRLIRFRSGPAISYDTQRFRYVACLVLFGLLSCVICFVGIEKLVCAFRLM